VEGNPFQFAAPLGDPDALVGRDDELARLTGLATSGTYVLLEAPRRFGKTSLVKACAARWREAGGLAVWVDFSRVLTAPEAAQRLEQALAPEHHPGWGEAVGELLRSVRLRVGPVQAGGLPAQSPPEPSARLHELLEVPADAARRRRHRSLVCFDEFQDVLAVPGLDGVVRAHVQHHADDVSYVFCGSEPSLLRELFGERGRPLYAQAKPLRLGRIAPAALATEIIERFAAEGVAAGEAAEAVARFGAGHPQRTVLLAWHLWDQADGTRPLTAADAETALDAAIVDARPEFEATWRAFAGNERRVAVALALGIAPLGKQAKAVTGVASASAAQRALGRLIEQGFAEQHAGTETVLTDPLLGAWLAREHAG
jgi:hypothetical protein